MTQSRLRVFINRILLFVLGMELVSKQESDELLRVQQALVDSNSQQGKDIVDLLIRLEEAKNRLKEQESSVLRALGGCGAGISFDRDLGLADKVSQAIEAMYGQAHHAAELRYGRDRVNLLLGLVRRLAIAAGFSEGDAPSEVHVTDRIERMRKQLDAQGAFIKTIMSQPVRDEKDPELVSSPFMTGLMFQWLTSLLEGDLQTALTGQETEQPPAPNYVSFEINELDSGQCVEVVVQRAGKLTPASKYAAAQDSLTTLRNKVLVAEHCVLVDGTWTAAQGIDFVIGAAKEGA